MQPNNGRNRARFGGEDDRWPREPWRHEELGGERRFDRDRDIDRDRDRGRDDRWDADDRDRDRGSSHLFERDDERRGYGPQGYGPRGYGPQGYGPQGYGPQGYGQGGYIREERGVGGVYGSYGVYGGGGYQGSIGESGAYGQGTMGQRNVGLEHLRQEARVGGHRGKGPRDFKRSDERIREQICEILTDDDRIDASQIDIEVKDGEVTLSGSVEDRRMKRLAEDVIEDLPGVRDVHNQIKAQRFFGWGSSAKGTGGVDVDQLNRFLRGELSAVETYKMALDKLDRSSMARGEVEACLRSHEERVTVIRNHIRRLGGSPATSSGPWGFWAKLVEGGARILGDKAAIAALEEGEDHGLEDYRDDNLDASSRDLVKTRLLPAQEETHRRMSALKRRLNAS